MIVRVLFSTWVLDDPTDCTATDETRRLYITKIRHLSHDNDRDDSPMQNCKCALNLTLYTHRDRSIDL